MSPPALITRIASCSLILSLAIFSFVHAQVQRADSIIHHLSEVKEPSLRVDSLNTLGFDLIFTDPTEARVLFNEAIEQASAHAYSEGKAKALKNKAISYDIQGNSNQAIAYYQESLTILESLQDTLGISRLKNNLGIAYKNLDDIETARKFYQESIALKEQLGDIRGVAYGLNNVGELYQKEGVYSEALDRFIRSNEILDSLGDDRGRSVTLSNIAVTHMELGDYRTAISYLIPSMEIDKRTEDYYSLAFSNVLLAKAYLNTNKPVAGMAAIRKAEEMSQDIGALKIYYDSQVLKAKLIKKTNRSEELPALYEKILVLNDSLARLNLVEETARMKAVYESREKERVIEELKSEKVLNQQLLDIQQQVSNISLIALVILVLLLTVVIIQFRGVRKKKGELEKKIEERDAARREAEQASMAKSQFLAQMSHEVRTPLNAIIGYSDQLIETELNDLQHKHLTIVNESAMGLLGIINSILDLSKLEAGKLELFLEDTDLFELCNYVMEMCREKATRKSIKLKLTQVDDEFRYVLTDDLRLRQVLANLLANAVKFTEKGEVELKVEVIEHKGDQVRFRFSVRDTGIGIKPENLNRIFLAFSQEDSTTTRRYGGTGLGLSISNTLLSLMDSHLIVESTLGKGSTFSFEVMLSLAKDLSSNGLSARKYHSGSIPRKVVSASDKLKVLVAEDNPTNMLLVRMMLKKALPNSKIIEVGNGAKAVTSFEEEGPDVILMDVQMPEMDGYAASKAIRAKEKGTRTPIIAITAGSMQTDKEKCYDAGMDDFISKPIVNDALTVTLEKWIKHK